MKLTKIILTGVLATAMMSPTFAATNSIDDSTSLANVEEVVNEVESRKEIKITALPAAVTKTLKKEAYSDCKVEKAYVIEEKGEKTYEIEVKRGTKNETLYFNEEGVEIED